MEATVLVSRSDQIGLVWVYSHVGDPCCGNQVLLGWVESLVCVIPNIHLPIIFTYEHNGRPCQREAGTSVEREAVGGRNENGVAAAHGPELKVKVVQFQNESFYKWRLVQAHSADSYSSSQIQGVQYFQPPSLFIRLNPELTFEQKSLVTYSKKDSLPIVFKQNLIAMQQLVVVRPYQLDTEDSPPLDL